MTMNKEINRISAMAVILSGLALMGGFHFMSQLDDLPKFLQFGATFLTYSIPVCIAAWYVLYDFKNLFAKKS